MEKGFNTDEKISVLGYVNHLVLICEDVETK